MSRLQYVSNRTLAVVAALVAAGLILGATTGVGAGEKTIEIHRMADARFDGFPDGPVFVAIVGTDDRPGVAGARADAVHLVGINPGLGKATVVNIPRDTWTNLPGHGTRKINDSHALGGADLVGASLRELSGANVQFVVTTNFEGFTNLVDEMGGVDVDLPVDINDSAAGAVEPAGPHRRSGASALAISRARKTVAGGDFGRTANQGRVLLGALRQIAAEDPGPARTIQLVAILMKHLRTTSGTDAAELYKLGRLALSLDPDKVVSVTMPGTTGVAGGGASVVFATPAAERLFADFRDDAVVEEDTSG